MSDQSPHQLATPKSLDETDAIAVAQLYARCAGYFLMQDGEPPALSDARALFTDVPPEKQPQDQTVLGWQGTDELDALVAILRDYPAEGIWYLGLMLVDPALRRQGMGRSLYATVEQWAAAQGATEIRLAVLEENAAAERFWRSLGFEERRRTGPDDFKGKSHRRVELHRHLTARNQGDSR